MSGAGCRAWASDVDQNHLVKNAGPTPQPLQRGHVRTIDLLAVAQQVRWTDVATIRVAGDHIEGGHMATQAGTTRRVGVGPQVPLHRTESGRRRSAPFGVALLVPHRTHDRRPGLDHRPSARDRSVPVDDVAIQQGNQVRAHPVQDLGQPRDRHLGEPTGEPGDLVDGVLTDLPDLLLRRQIREPVRHVVSPIAKERQIHA
jgi:hypothetical protein